MILNHAHAMIFDTELPKSLWPYAVAYTCHLKNRSSTHTLNGKTPFELFYNKKPDISSVRIFGCDMWVLNQDHKGKLDPQSHKYKFIGLSDETCTCWYYKPANGEVAKSCNIIFPHSHPIPTFPIPIPSPPEGESRSIDGQSSQEDPDNTQETTDDDLETPDDKVELTPDDRCRWDNDLIPNPPGYGVLGEGMLWDEWGDYLSILGWIL